MATREHETKAVIEEHKALRKELAELERVTFHMIAAAHRTRGDVTIWDERGRRM